MPDLRRAPARPGQTVEVAANLRIVLGRAQRHQIELVLVLHVRLQPLRRLAGVAGAPASAIHFAQDVLGHRTVAFDLDVLEHLVGEAELLGHQIKNLIVVLGLEAWRDDRLAPLQRAVGRNARAGSFELGAYRQQIHVVLAPGRHRKRGPGGGMRIGDDQQIKLRQRFHRFRDARDAVAGVPLHEHGAHVVLLIDLIPRQQERHRTSASAECPGFPSSSWNRSGRPDSRSRPPRRDPNVSMHLR